MNNVTLIGRITKDIELKKTPTGKSVVSFNLAVNRIGEGADFPTCIAWEKTAEILSKYAKKGSQVGITGSIQTRSYEDAYGKRVYLTEVLVREAQLLDTKKQEEKQDEFMTPTIDVTSDDLPF